MANFLQIFVFALALAQGYCAVDVITLPAFIQGPVSNDIEPMPLPSAPVVSEQPALPPCVSVVKNLLQAIIGKLENLPGIVPLPEIIEPEVVPGVPAVPEYEELPQGNENPCTPCFNHVNSLLVTAQQLVTLRKVTRQ